MTDQACASVVNERPGGLRNRLAGVCGLLVAGNIAAWTWGLIAFHGSPILLGAAFLAYGFGLRHAVDADHIAAIDNVTRKLMQQGKRPVTIGLFFALGHSTVVVTLAVLIALTAATPADRDFGFTAIGGGIGAGASALFLFAIAAANILVLGQAWKALRLVKRGRRLTEQEFDRLPDQRGLLCGIFRRLFRLVGRSWHMYPLGLLFGLGFDTATEVGLLGISASQASHGLSIASVLVFPALFTAGMSLIDTTDGVIMLGAYGWAFAEPIRKLHYNLTITFLTVVAALGVGMVEALGLASGKLGSLGNAVGTVSDHFGTLGYGIIGLLVIAWLVSFLLYRTRACDGLGAQT